MQVYPEIKNVLSKKKHIKQWVTFKLLQIIYGQQSKHFGG